MLRYYLNLRTFFIPGFRFLCSYVCYFVLCALISCPPGVYRWTLSFELACIMHTAVLNPTLALRKWSHAPWKPSICVCAASAEFEYRRAALVLIVYDRVCRYHWFEMFVALTALSCSCLALTLAQEAMPGAPEACIDGYYHKDAPSAETTPFEACGSWQMLSCCSYSTARNISRYGSRMLYDFRWDLCGNLSTECENYIRVSYFSCMHACMVLGYHIAWIAIP